MEVGKIVAFGTNIFLFFFLPFAVAGYYLLPKKFRNIFFLVASLGFYCWETLATLPFLLFSLVMNYLIGILLDDYKDHLSHRNTFFVLGISLNLLPLFFFKYLNFSLGYLNQMLGTNIALNALLVPIGISFFTFQGISYITEVYRKNVASNRSFLQIAIYMCAFPKMMSGPIVKYTDMQCQLEVRTVTVEAFSRGLERFVIGLSKKLMIADVLGDTADIIFGRVYQGMEIPTMWLGVICYTLQIYYDFSGYSDMAIGIGSLFGFNLPENFNYPYISKSISEFWRRWHITLSSWFRDYIYIPLGGSRWGNVYVNLAIVFAITGLWHGASFNFIFWGIWNGAFVILERVLSKREWKFKLPNIAKHIITLFVVMIGWVFFRAGNMANAISYLQILFGVTRSGFVPLTFFFYLDARIIFSLLVACVGTTPIVANLANRFVDKKWFQITKTLIIAGLFILNIMFVMNNTYRPSIYFQF